MTILPFSAAIIFCLHLLSLLRPLHGLGGGSSIAAVSSGATVCGVVAGESSRRIECFQNQRRIFVNPAVSYDAVSGGGSFFCGVRAGGSTLLCWDVETFESKRVYFSQSNPLREISVGFDQVCGVFNGTGRVQCWRGIKGYYQNLNFSDGFRSVSSGFGFSCGVLMSNSSVRCWGSNASLAGEIETKFSGVKMKSIEAGGMHVCGFDLGGVLVCEGSNSSGQLDFPSPGNEGNGFKKLALGLDYSCGLRESNGTVVCWGGGGGYTSNVTKDVEFVTLVGAWNFTCGLVSLNLSIICWGPGWVESPPLQGNTIPSSFPKILPGPCVQSDCSPCGIVPDSQALCSGSGNICNTCVSASSNTTTILPPTLPPPSPQEPSKRLTKSLLAFAIVGSVGSVAGICSIVYCLYTGVCWGRKKIHNSVQPTIARGGSSTSRTSSTGPPSRSLTIRRQGSRIMRRQRSGTSSTKHADRAEEFSFQELAFATNNFSWENKIGSGSFGVVYRGKLSDGREVAIKRSETSPRTKKLQEKESAFESELSFLSRLHHKHLVRLVGYCDEREERLLVYEYMKHGALYDHLHTKNNIEKESSVINSWSMRIRIALDAARGIEYLHSYAVPPIIHRDIKSSNILLDAYWTARVSDFGLSMLGPSPESEGNDLRPSNAAGTIGYIDPEYYGLNVLTAKSDVYGFGVVLLELLTGKKAIFKNGSDGGEAISVVDYACPAIMAGEVVKVLDPRVGPPESNESEAVELVSYTALHCVNLEGKDRPTMTDIVANLERALSLCADDPQDGNIPSSEIFLASD